MEQIQEKSVILFFGHYLNLVRGRPYRTLMDEHCRLFFPNFRKSYVYTYMYHFHMYHFHMYHFHIHVSFSYIKP